MAGAFQSNAFQTNAFQVYPSGGGLERPGTPQIFARDPNCCCNTGTGTGTGPPCDCNCCLDDGGYYSRYRMTVAGVTPIVGAGCESTPEQCTTFNGTFDLVHTTDCIWETEDFFVHDCGGSPTTGGPVWTMMCVKSGTGTGTNDSLCYNTWTLTPQYNDLFYSSTDFNCMTGGTFTLDPGSGGGVPDCEGWPTTIVVSPIGDPNYNDENCCVICCAVDELTTGDLYFTITAADGDLATVWFSGTGYSGALPHSFLANVSVAHGQCYDDSSVETCGGLVTIFTICATCVNNEIVLDVEFGHSRDVTCVVDIPAFGGTDVTWTYGDIVCNENGFVSMDFSATTPYGNFSGTLHR